ncbi:hypothetical protein TW85_21870 [Marinomonas sp. S3726]|uniref:hypothetical protein n=1 Tax=Marinomonas sp. S3726 TaxID=579484 RepID=UPI0005FA6F4C|nr:hypothetical protein [Marinomonas sp. S3726]KJZ09591.1 hypothetical protein TW85_21870 [Marinomonas sp. S3726]
MDFVISEGFISRRKKRITYLTVFLILLPVGFEYLSSEETFNWKVFAITEAIVLFFGCLPQVNDLRKIIKNVKNHNLNVSSKGFSFVDYGVETIITWDLVTHVELKRKGNKFKKFLVVTEDAGKMDLLDYSDLEGLALEIKRHIGLDRVKER